MYILINICCTHYYVGPLNPASLPPGFMNRPTSGQSAWNMRNEPLSNSSSSSSLSRTPNKSAYNVESSYTTPSSYLNKSSMSLDSILSGVDNTSPLPSLYSNNRSYFHSMNSNPSSSPFPTSLSPFTLSPGSANTTVSSIPELYTNPLVSHAPSGAGSSHVGILRPDDLKSLNHTIPNMVSSSHNNAAPATITKVFCKLCKQDGHYYLACPNVIPLTPEEEKIADQLSIAFQEFVLRYFPLV